MENIVEQILYMCEHDPKTDPHTTFAAALLETTAERVTASERHIAKRFFMHLVMLDCTLAYRWGIIVGRTEK